MNLKMLEHTSEKKQELALPIDVPEMLLLASRLKQSHGGDLDDDAILAVCEATGASPEYVRLALRSVGEQKKLGISRVRSVFLSLDPEVRTYVMAGIFGCLAGMSQAASATWFDRFSLLGLVQIAAVIGALINCGKARDQRTASVSGAIFGGTVFISTSVFMAILSIFVFESPNAADAWLLIPFLVVGALAGGLMKRVFNKFMRKIGVQDATSERQELLQQLVQLQDKLKESEQSLTFLCVDVVGSTKMKQTADPLAIEFTFGEYHKYIETIARKHMGRIHSTAGDGVTCAFENPHNAFAAARNMQAGLIELNTHRNRIGTPLKLRCGVHHGTVMAPNGDIQSVNFSHVIDVASHLQRVCPEGGVAISELAAAYIPGGPNGISEERAEAQEVSAVIWRPRTSIV